MSNVKHRIRGVKWRCSYALCRLRAVALWVFILMLDLLCSLVGARRRRRCLVLGRMFAMLHLFWVWMMVRIVVIHDLSKWVRERKKIVERVEKIANRRSGGLASILTTPWGHLVGQLLCTPKGLPKCCYRKFDLKSLVKLRQHCLIISLSFATLDQ